jgi:hypothetical protein
MNEQRYRLYFRLGATVLALSGLTNVMVVIEHRSLTASSAKLAAESSQIEHDLPTIDRLVRDLAVAGSPDPDIGNILRQAGIVVSLPTTPSRPATNNVPASKPSAGNETAPTDTP